VTLIRAGAIGAKRGGDPFKNLTPTGRWIGGVGITLNTTPDPDQISAWADQSGNARHLVTVVEAQQPVATLWTAPDQYVPTFGAPLRRLVSSTAGSSLYTTTNFTAIWCASTSSAVGSGTATNPFDRPALFGGENGDVGLLAYTVSGSRWMSCYIRDAAANQYAPANIAIPTDSVAVLAMRLTAGTTLKSYAFYGSTADSAEVAAATTVALTGGQRLGQGRSNLSITQWRGTAYEGATFNTALPDADITAIAAYMLARYS
jgi:hypothetical protein